MKGLAFVILALVFAINARAFGQVDHSKEVKAIVTTKPAVEHFYSCPTGYDLKYFVKVTLVSTSEWATSTPYEDHYEAAPAQDIMRTGEPTCVPTPTPLLTLPTSLLTLPPPLITLHSKKIAIPGFNTFNTFTFPACHGKVVVLHLDTGKVDIPEGCPKDKAAAEFWELLKQYAKGNGATPAK